MDSVWRRDGAIGEKNELRMIFAWRLPASGRSIREGMLMLYSLTPHEGKEPTIYVPGMTHEFTVYEIDPGTPIDFSKSLFEQKSLSPLMPAMIGFQFRASSSREAANRAQDLVMRVLSLDLPPDVPEEWASLMRDGVDIASALVDTEAAVERARVQAGAGGKHWSIPKEMRARYQLERAPTFKAKAGIMATFAVLGALVTAGTTWVAVAVEPDWLLSHTASLYGSNFHRSLVLPDGKEVELTLRHVEGEDPRKLHVLEMHDQDGANPMSRIQFMAHAYTGAEVDQLADIVHAREGDEFTVEVRTPNGQIFMSKLRKDGLAPRAYAVLENFKADGFFVPASMTVAPKGAETPPDLH